MFLHSRNILRTTEPPAILSHLQEHRKRDDVPQWFPCLDIGHADGGKGHHSTSIWQHIDAAVWCRKWRFLFSSTELNGVVLPPKHFQLKGVSVPLHPAVPLLASAKSLRVLLTGRGSKRCCSHTPWWVPAPFHSHPPEGSGIWAAALRPRWAVDIGQADPNSTPLSPSQPSVPVRVLRNTLTHKKRKS